MKTAHLIYIVVLALTWTLCCLGQDAAVQPTPWQIETQRALDALGIKAAFRNKSFTLVIPEGEYDFVSLRIPKNVSLIAEPSTTRSVRLRYVGRGDDTLVTLQGYGSRFSGFDLIAKDPKAPRLVGIHVEKALNAEVDRIRFAHYGVDTQGILVAGRESITIQKCEFRCSVPVSYLWGDNVAFRDMDIGGATSAESLATMNDQFPSTVVWLQGQPNQVVFDGSQTWQGCAHAMFGEIDSAKTGQNLNIYNLRYEQSTSQQDPEVAAIHLTFANRACENVMLVGCRMTARRGPAIKVDYNTSSPLVPKITTVGCFLPRLQ